MFQPKDEDLKVRITSRHEVLTEALRNEIEAKVQRLERFLGRLQEAHVILTYEKKSHVCEANLKGAAATLASKGRSHDMYQSIEACFAKIQRQAARVKDKRVKRPKPTTRTLGSIRHGVLAPPEENTEVRVIRSRMHAVKPMSVEEAALQLTGSRDEFLVFHNAETDRTNVVYKRLDHHIGLIEPEA